MDDLERRALELWRAYVLEGIRDGGLDTVLTRYTAYKAAAASLAAWRGELGRLAAALPDSAEIVSRVRQVRSQIAEAIGAAVNEDGLSESVVDFLRCALQGVPLAEVLANPEVVTWLRDKDHAAGFLVRGS